MSLAPIVLFVYNRPEHTLKTLEALAQNDLASQSELFVYCDGPKTDATKQDQDSIYSVREILKKKQWCKTVTIKESHLNKGLADSIVEGVTEIVNRYGKIIVLEDDIVTSKGFLTYMNDALDIYQSHKKVMHIGSYIPYTNFYKKLPETFFSRFMSCWGWATWKTSWDMANWNECELYDQIKDPNARYEFNLEGVLNFHEQLERNISGAIKTWAIKWFASIFRCNGLCLYPSHSLTKNIGFDGTGENCDVLLVKELKGKNNFIKIKIKKIKIQESRIGKQYLKRYYRYGNDSDFKKRFKRKCLDFRYQLVKKIKEIEF
jgi:GT2 family glycosyltransferase